MKNLTAHKVTISPEYQVVIPLEIRQSLDIQPGQELQIIEHENRLELIPLRSMEAARGMLKGIDTRIEREGDRL